MSSGACPGFRPSSSKGHTSHLSRRLNRQSCSAAIAIGYESSQEKPVTKSSVSQDMSRKESSPGAAVRRGIKVELWPHAAGPRSMTAGSRGAKPGRNSPSPPPPRNRGPASREHGKSSAFPHAAERHTRKTGKEPQLQIGAAESRCPLHVMASVVVVHPRERLGFSGDANKSLLELEGTLLSQHSSHRKRQIGLRFPSL